MQAIRSLSKRKATKDGENNWTQSDTKRLKELFTSGSLRLTDPATKLGELDKHFARFNMKVLATRLGQLRKEIGSSQTLLKLRPSPASSDNDDDNAASSKDDVAEAPPVTSESSDDDECSLTCSHMPFLRFTYMDGTKEKLVILLDLPSGSTNYEWDFNSVGDGINLQVEWSPALYDDICSLLDAACKTGQLTLDNSKAQAMQDILSKKCKEQIPKCCMEVSLGKQVCKDDDSWEATVIKHRGSKILMIEFSEYRNVKKVKRGSLDD